MTAINRVYIIGDRDTGVAVVMMNPLRAVKASREVIEQYAMESGQSFDEAFGAIAGALKGLILKTDGPDVPKTGKAQYEMVADLVATGTSVVEADFCYVADVDAAQWKIFRAGFIAIEPFIGTLLDAGDSPEAPVGKFSDQN